MKLLGVPLPIWGVVCLAVAAVWLFVWPRQKAAATGVRFFILRWFHAVVWLLLAAAAFIAGFNVLGGVNTAQPVAWLSLLTYLIFMLTFATAKSEQAPLNPGSQAANAPSLGGQTLEKRAFNVALRQRSSEPLLPIGINHRMATGGSWNLERLSSPVTGQACRY